MQNSNSDTLEASTGGMDQKQECRVWVLLLHIAKPAWQCLSLQLKSVYNDAAA